MAKLIARALLALLLSAVPGTAQARQEHQHGGSEKLGTVKFVTSCAPAVAPAFNRAMALLHSFEFLPAIEGFTAVSTTDSGCAIAYWGMAVSRWGNPFSAGLKTPAATPGRAGGD